MNVAKDYLDQELVAALKSPRQIDEAIKFIYRQHYSMLENYVLNNNGSEQDAGDVIQETIVAFIEIVQEEKFRGDASVKSFLYSIAKNIWLSEMRKRNSADNRNRIFEKGKDDTEKEVVQNLVYREHYKAIQDLFGRLGEKCKELLFLVYYEDLSMKDILEKVSGYENEQVLRNKKYKCMKQLEQMINNDDNLKTQFKNALKNAG